MTKTSHTNAALLLLTCLAILARPIVTLAQQSGFGHAQPNPAAPTAPPGEPGEAIALTVWILTVADPADPEADELTGQLHEKSNNLPAVVGSGNDARKLVGRLKAAGLLRSSREIRLLTLNGQPAQSQSGADLPSVVGVNIGDFGQMSNIQYRSTGTIVQATPLIDSAGGIQVSFVYNSSQITKSEDVAISAPKEGEAIAADVIETTQLNTIVRLDPGTAVLVHSDAKQVLAGNKRGEANLIVLAAEIVSPAGKGG